MQSKHLPLTYAGLVFCLALAGGINAYGENKTLATVNNDTITNQDIQTELKSVPEKLLSGRQNEIQKAIVARLIQKRLVMDEAKKLGILEDESFKAQLATLKENLVFNFVLSRKVDKLVTPEKLRAYYQENKQRFTLPSVKVSHILLPTKKEAQRAIEQLNDGEDFTELAQAISTGPSATKGGKLGWVTSGDMVARFEAAAFRLDKGEYTRKPVKTQFGWHVITVENKKEDRTKPFSEVEEKVLKKLSEKVVQNYLNELQEKAEIEYTDN